MRTENVWHRLATLLVVWLALSFTGCMQSPQVKSAKAVEAGKKLLQKNDPSRAILQFRNAIQATPKNAEAFYQLSLGYWAVGDVRMAIGSLRKALELNPKHVEAQLRIAQIMSIASDPALVKDAQQRLAKMLEEAPDNADTLHALSFTELKLGEPENAIEHLGRAMALAPNDIMIAVSLAQAKLQQQDAKGAEQVLRKAVQNSPKSANATVMLGRFYLSQTRWPEAEQEFQRAVSLEPNNGQALLDLAKLQNSLGRKADAEQNFKRLSALPDKTFKPLHAIFLFQEGRRDEAIRKFENLAKEDPEDRQARVRLIGRKWPYWPNPLGTTAPRITIKRPRPASSTTAGLIRCPESRMNFCTQTPRCAKCVRWGTARRRPNGPMG